ncbi:MAG: hypothetical protein DWQ29_12805, partial [Planctomycetota bacterium]
QALSRVRQERSTQPVFPPQFLSRIKRIMIFSPLDESAMIGIAERVCRRMQQLWLQKREKRIEIARAVIEQIGRRAHRLNEQSNGQEGGRIVRKMVSDLIETRIQSSATEDGAAYKHCTTILVSAAESVPSEERSDGEADHAPLMNVRFDGNRSAEE